MTTSEKVAYLKGLAEGLGVDKETKEGRILDSVIDILEDLAHDIEDLEENAWELGEAIDQVSDDLADIERTTRTSAAAAAATKRTRTRSPCSTRSPARPARTRSP